MSQPTAELVGLKEANRALKNLPAIAKPGVQHVFDVTAFQVARTASLLAPRSAHGTHGHEAGFLAKSIQWSSRPRSLSAVVAIAAAAFYWKFLEFGTRFIAARPFLRPSADGLRTEHHRLLIQALQKAAKDVAAQAKHG